MSLLSLASNLGSGGIFTYIEIGVIVAVIGAIGYLYMDNKAVKANLKAAVEVQQQLKDTVNADQLEITKTKAAIVEQQTITQDLSSKNTILDTNLAKLQGAMSIVVNGQKIDLQIAAKQQPTLVEQKINQGTKNALRCDELATGAIPVTADATNPACPELVKNVVVPNVKK